MSRKEESIPEAQKNCQGAVSPSSAPRAFRIASAGIMVTKMPAKSTATSTMGAQVKPFSSRQGPRAW